MWTTWKSRLQFLAYFVAHFAYVTALFTAIIYGIIVLIGVIISFMFWENFFTFLPWQLHIMIFRTSLVLGTVSAIFFEFQEGEIRRAAKNAVKLDNGDVKDD